MGLRMILTVNLGTTMKTIDVPCHDSPSQTHLESHSTGLAASPDQSAADALLKWIGGMAGVTDHIHDY